MASMLGFQVEDVGSTTVLIDPSSGTDAWFSYWTQLRWLFETLQIDLVIDVGANVGQFARDVRRYYSGDILSFEPVPAAFEKLAANAASDSKWSVFNVALGSRETSMPMIVAKDTRFSSILRRNEFSAQRFEGMSEETESRNVAVRRLDQMLSEAVTDAPRRRIFLKMDTQGFDLEVFRGSANCLGSVAALQSELSLIPIYEGMPHWTDALAEYERAGFNVVGMFPFTRDDGHVIEYDSLLSRRRGSLDGRRTG